MHLSFGKCVTVIMLWKILLHHSMKWKRQIFWKAFGNICDLNSLSSKELEDPVGNVTCKVCWDEKSPWLRYGRWWCYSCAWAPCQRTDRWRNDGTYEFRRLQKNLYSQMRGDFTRDSLWRVWHSPGCSHLHQSNKMTCDALFCYREMYAKQERCCLVHAWEI